jgi:hypothetical protein
MVEVRVGLKDAVGVIMVGMIVELKDAVAD